MSDTARQGRGIAWCCLANLADAHQSKDTDMAIDEGVVERVALAILAEQAKEAFPNNLNLARAVMIGDRFFCGFNRSGACLLYTSDAADE